MAGFWHKDDIGKGKGKLKKACPLSGVEKQVDIYFYKWYYQFHNIPSDILGNEKVIKA